VGTRAERIMRDQTELFDEAERLLTLRAAGTPDPKDGTVYAALGWNPKEVKDQVQRAESVAAFKRRAGTAAVRAQAEEEAKAAAEDARTGNAKDLALIEEAQGRIAKRSDRLGAAEREVFGRTEALGVLRDEKMLPDHIRMRRRMDRSACDHPDHRRLAEARGRVLSIGPILALEPASDHLDNVKLHCEANPDVGELCCAWGRAPAGSSAFPAGAWQKYLERLRSEREPLLVLIGEFTPADRERQAAVDRLLDYHVDKLG